MALPEEFTSNTGKCRNCGKRIVQIDDEPYFKANVWYHDGTMMEICSINKLANDPTNIATPILSDSI
jgi:hypothetical protein